MAKSDKEIDDQVEKIGKAHGMPRKVIEETKKEMKENKGKSLNKGKDEARRVRTEATRAAVKDPEGVSGQRLKSFIERVERLEEEKKTLTEDIRDVYSESKSTGFEPKIIRKIVSLRKSNLEKRREEQELLDLYMSAIGMVE